MIKQVNRLLINEIFSTRSHELELLNEAKAHARELDLQKHELERADAFPDSSQNTEVGRLRAQILHYHNEFVQTNERQYQLEYKMEG